MPGRKDIPDLVGRTLAHYRVKARLGEGGMGEVYLAEDLRLRRRIALKVLPPHLASEPRHLERFQREARSVAALNHPNIVAIHAVEEVEGLHFLVLELIEGETLAELLASGPLPFGRVLEIMLPLTDALGAAHERGVIHRDLKPPNIMVSREGRIKILDFGIARVVSREQHSKDNFPETTLTRDGKIVGTIPYMSPEQLQGHAVDSRTDLFSLGIILYEMATGRRPFRGDSELSLAASILSDTPLAPSSLAVGLPPCFDQIVSRCLAKEPFLRYQSAGEFRSAVMNLTISEEPTLAGTLAGPPLSPSSDASSSSSAMRRGTNPRLPARPRCFGRDAEIRQLVEALCGYPLAPVPVLGPAGAGKTTIILAALHDAQVTERFGKRRWFVRCDGATGRDSLVGAIARAVCPDAVPPLEPKVFSVLEDAPAALALDNLETPWERETAEVEELLVELAAISGLALAVALRGEQRPFGPSWREAIHAGPLDPDSARNAFLAVAGERYQNDPDLNPLLLDLDGLALAIVLLASQAEGEPDLSMLRLRWQEQRTVLLRRTGARERQRSLESSLGLSINSPRMTDESRRLLSILSLLPEGAAREDLAALLPGHGIGAASVLRKVGLAFDQGSRLRLLAPIREQVRHRNPPLREDLDRTIRHYMDLAHLGEEVGQEDGAAAARRLGPETGNLEAMILMGLSLSDSLPAIRAALSYGGSLRFTGQGSLSVLSVAGRSARLVGETKLEADCLYRQGEIEVARSRSGEGESNFEKALALYRLIDDSHGEACCLQSLGEIQLFLRTETERAKYYLEAAHRTFRTLGDAAWEGRCLTGLGCVAVSRSDYVTARALLERARFLLQQAGRARDEANCLQRMGQGSIDLWDLEQARREFKAALPLFQRVGSLLGEANCLKSLGQIAVYEGDARTARMLGQKALGLSRRTGSLLGEANCLFLLGEAACAQLEHEQAENLLQHARQRFRRIGQMLGEANCATVLGKNAALVSDLSKARSWFEEALSLLRRIPRPISIGRVHLALAKLSPPGSPERLEQIEAARRAWEEAGLLDQMRAELDAVAQAGSEPS